MKTFLYCSFAVMLWVNPVLLEAQIVNPFAGTDIEAALAELTKAERMVEDGYYEEAVKLLQSIKKDDPRIEVAHQILFATVQRQLEHFRKAEETLLELIEAYPRESKALFALSVYYFDMTEYDKAIVYLERVIERLPDAPLPHYKLYLSRILTEQKPDIPEIFREFDASNPGYFFVRAAKAFSEGQQSKGKYFMQGAIQLFPPSDSLRMIRPLFQTGWVHPEDLYLREHPTP